MRDAIYLAQAGIFNFQFSIFTSYFILHTSYFILHTSYFVLLYNQPSEIRAFHMDNYADIFDFGDFVRVICQRQPGAITDLSDFASIA